MAPISKSGVVLSDWPGLVTNAGRFSVAESPGEAESQINMRSVAQGEMSARPGLRRIVTDEDLAE